MAVVLPERPSEYLGEEICLGGQGIGWNHGFVGPGFFLFNTEDNYNATLKNICSYYLVIFGLLKVLHQGLLLGGSWWFQTRSGFIKGIIWPPLPTMI